jgi:HEPN domain-containing protein
MRRPEDVKRELVRQWTSKAHDDLEAARHLSAHRVELGFAIGFHAQQAVEKCAKAMLVWHQIEFPKTHDIERLGELLNGVDPSSGELVRSASILSLYAVDARYPGDLPHPTPSEARSALAIAERVCSELLAALERRL